MCSGLSFGSCCVWVIDVGVVGGGGGLELDYVVFYVCFVWKFVVVDF